MTINGFSCNSPEVIFSFLIIPRWVFLKWVGECNSSDFPWRISCSSPRSRHSRVKVGVLRRHSHPKILTVSSVIWNIYFSLLVGVNTSFALSLRAWSSDASICSHSSMSATKMSPFQILPACNAHPTNIPGKTFDPNWCSLDWSFADRGRYPTIAPNGITGPSKWHSEPPFLWCLPIRPEILNVSQKAVTFQESPTIRYPDRTAEVPSFTLRTALSAIPFVSDLCGVDVQWFQDNSSQDMPNSKEMSV